MGRWARWHTALVLLGLAAWAISAHLASAGIGPADLRVVAAVAPLCVAAALLAWQMPHPRAGIAALAVAGTLALTGAWPWLRTHVPWLYYLQHLGTHLALALWFARSLAPGREPVVSAMARRIAPTSLTPRTLRYTRAVTWAWALFLAGNAAMSTVLFIWAPVPLWSTHANLLTWPLMALFFGLEMGVRARVLPPQERPALRDVMQAWQARRGTHSKLNRLADPLP